MNLDIAICDDNKNDLSQIRSMLIPYIYNSKHEISISEFSDSISVLESINNKSYDVYLLDIEFGDVNGIELAKSIKEKYSNEPYIIFISNYPEYMHDSFSVHPYYYIKKPTSAEELCSLIDEVLVAKSNRLESFTIINGTKKSIPVQIHDILYVKASGSKSRSEILFHLKNQEILSKGTINEWQDKLTDFSFLECYKGILVNIEHVHYIDKDTVVLDDNTTLPISRRRHKYIKEHMVNLINTYYK